MLDASHWSRLPTEIRLQIYKFLVPENYTFKLTYENGRAVVAEDCHHNQTPVRKCIQTALFYVSKQISRESRELLFSVNTFVLCAGAWEMRPSTSTSLAPTFQVPPDVGLSQARSVFTVATLQSIQHLEIHISLTKVVTRQNYECIYGWLRGLASALKQSNSLKTLNARCILGIYSYNRQGFLIYCLKEGGLLPQPYILEALVPLSGIKNVTIEGVDPAFATKLGCVMMESKKRKLKKLNYPEFQYKSRKRHCTQQVKRTKRKYYDRQYDWDEVEAKPAITAQAGLNSALD